MAGIDDYKNSLEGINAHYGNGMKGVTGTSIDYKNQVVGFQDYLNDLDEYSEAHKNDEGFDYTKWKLYRDHANSQLKQSQQAYDSAIAQDNLAQAGKIEQANIRDNALKYAQASIQAQGIQGQGVAGSVQAGINNQYGSNVSNIENTKNENKASILDSYRDAINTGSGQVETAVNEHEQQTKNDAFQLASEMMNNGSTYDKIIELYGNDLDDKQKATLKEVYSTAGGFDNEWIKANTINGQGFSSYDEAKEMGIKTENASYDIGDVSNEAKELFTKYSYGRQNGDVVRLQHHGGGSTNGMYIIYYNGKWYKTDKAHYDNATNRAMFENGRLQETWGGVEQSRGSFKN